MELSDATEKSPATPGIDPGTFWLVAQCLNHYATPGPLQTMYKCILWHDINVPGFVLWMGKQAQWHASRISSVLGSVKTTLNVEDSAAIATDGHLLEGK